MKLRTKPLSVGSRQFGHRQPKTSTRLLQGYFDFSLEVHDESALIPKFRSKFRSQHVCGKFVWITAMRNAYGVAEICSSTNVISAIYVMLERYNLLFVSSIRSLDTPKLILSGCRWNAIARILAWTAPMQAQNVFATARHEFIDLGSLGTCNSHCTSSISTANISKIRNINPKIGEIRRVNQ